MNCRGCNIPDIQHWNNYHYRTFSNALFNQTYKFFDNIFKQPFVTDNYELITEKRTGEIVTNDQFFTRFNVSKNEVIKNTKQFGEFLKIKKNLPAEGTMYFVYGKKGIGKSTLIRYYIDKYFDKSNNIAIYLNLHGITCSIDQIQMEIKRKIKNFIYNNDDFSKYYTDPNEARKVKPEFIHLDDQTVINYLYTDEHNFFSYLDSLLLFLNNSITGDIYIFYDNTDELKEDFIKTVIQSSYDLLCTIPVRVVHCLRDYWGRHSVINDGQYQTIVTYLTPPDIKDILEKRIKNLSIPRTSASFKVDYYYRDDFGRRKEDSKLITFNDAATFFENSIPYLLGDLNVVNKIFEISNYNIRDVLDNVYNFYHSCNLPILPLFQKLILNRPNDRLINFNDVLRNVMTVHSLCFDFDSSKIINIFSFKNSCGYSSYRNTLGLLRILQRISINEISNLQDVVNDLISLGYDDLQLKNGINYLLIEGLVESIDGISCENIVTISITSKGDIYLKEIINNFEYLSYIQDRVSMPYEFHCDIFERFGRKNDLSGSGSFDKRRSAVINFVKFLKQEEEKETEEYDNELMRDILYRVRGQGSVTFNNEYDLILNKTITDIQNSITASRARHEIVITDINPINQNDESSGQHSHPER